MRYGDPPGERPLTALAQAADHPLQPPSLPTEWPLLPHPHSSLWLSWFIRGLQVVAPQENEETRGT